jgi:hypothetical protein
VTPAPKRRLETTPDPTTAKALGAFYTDARVAAFLVGWAIRSPRDTVIDPSFGGGVFLEAACVRLRALGGDPSRQVSGIEIDPAVHARIRDRLALHHRLEPDQLRRASFFDVDPTAGIDAVVGNPPFIRYQRFTGESRRRALACAARQGVQLSALSSSWAPFLVHSIAAVRPGGRLAMVIPVELIQATYARPVLEHLARSFAAVTFLTFRERLFPTLSEDTLLVLAEGRGSSCASFHWRDLADAAALGPATPAMEVVSATPGTALEARAQAGSPGTVEVAAPALWDGRERLLEHLVPAPARALYQALSAHTSVYRLGALAEVGIGYVTGANDFFHPGPADVRRWKLPEDCLRRAIRRGRALSGVRFTLEDWERATRDGNGGHLLWLEPDRPVSGAERPIPGAERVLPAAERAIPRTARPAAAAECPVPEAVQRYLAHGEATGIPLTFKCRTRTPWFRVPNVYPADAFLTYMSGDAPRLVVNETDAVAPNTLHVIRLRPSATLTASSLAVAWQTSLSRLSAELEGHAMGGGMLKLEPGEAQRVLLALPPEVDWGALLEPLDASLRHGSASEAQAMADRALLERGLGLSSRESAMLRDAAELLRARRTRRGPVTPR